MFENALTNTLSSELSEAFNSDASIRDIGLEYKTRFARSVKAHETGDLSNLTEADLETYRQIADLPEMDEVFDRTIDEAEYAEIQRQQMEDEARALEDEDAARSGVRQEKPDEPEFTSARYSDNSNEVSSAGDKRFSAFYAKLKDGRSIEKAYQEAKGSGKGQL